MSNSGASSGTSWSELENRSDFISRHVGPSTEESEAMLTALGVKSFDELVKQTIPAGIMLQKGLDLGEAVPETEMLSRARVFASQNKVVKSFIGTGYYGTFTPNVILRNVLENPGWYTAYTPYQAEIAQGRLEALLNFQTMISDLTGLPVSNASLLDEGTAAAEAMHLCQSVTKLKVANRIVVADDFHPQTIEVIRRRAEPLEIEVAVLPVDKFTFDDKTFAAFVQYPSTTGLVTDYSKTVQAAHAAGALVVAAADLLSLTMLKAPGEWGADVCIGTSQRLGVPMGFGGPHGDTWQRKMISNAQFLAASLAFRSMRKIDQPCVSLFKHVSNISAAKSDVEHLYRSGSLGRHGFDVCGLSWTGRPSSYR